MRLPSTRTRKEPQSHRKHLLQLERSRRGRKGKDHAARSAQILSGNSHVVRYPYAMQCTRSSWHLLPYARRKINESSASAFRFGPFFAFCEEPLSICRYSCKIPWPAGLKHSLSLSRSALSGLTPGFFSGHKRVDLRNKGLSMVPRS